MNHGYNYLGEYVFERLKMGETLWEIKSSWVRIGDFVIDFPKKKLRFILGLLFGYNTKYHGFHAGNGFLIGYENGI